MWYVAEEQLREFVVESNRIEDIEAVEGDSLFDSHLICARRVARGDFLHPNNLHAILARGNLPLADIAGRFRSVEVEVGDVKTPISAHVPSLMKKWWEVVCDFHTSELGEYSEKVIVSTADSLHDWFECIHPYEDGNGRVGRLFLNTLRLSKGLEWLIIKASERWQYYARIQNFRDTYFNTKYPDVYHTN